MYEYKVVPAPQRAVKVKGLKSTADRFAHALAERINAEAAGGWEFLRTETLTCEERTGLGRRQTTTQTVMVFGRARGQTRPDAGAALAAVQHDPVSEPYQPDEASYAAAVEARTDEAGTWDEPAQEDWTRHDSHDPAHDAPMPTHQPDPRADALDGHDSQVPPPRRQEPLFRSGARLHGDRPARPEPVIRPPRGDHHGSE